MSRVMVIGIDSLDTILLSKFKDDLPNLRRLMEESPKLNFESVYPPDSASAWPSIYTGVSPAKHGAIVTFVDPNDRSKVTVSENLEDITGKILADSEFSPFWDIAGAAGKKVCILFPFLIYPPKAVNGIMISRSQKRNTKRFPVRSYPDSIATKNSLSELNTLKGNALSRTAPRFIEAGRKLVLSETKFALEAVQNFEWDLFFMYSAVLDGFGHNLWRYCDENDPSYPGDNPYKETIKDCYKLYDEFIGAILDAVGSDTTTIVLSDHGHGMRPTRVINVNELLRNKGFLVPKSGPLSIGSRAFSVDTLKMKLQKFVTDHNFSSVVAKLLVYFPAWRKIYVSTTPIDWQKTVAYLTDLSGVNVYSYAGIKIRRENLKEIEYEELRNKLIKELFQVRDPDSGENLFRWICRREELYQGRYISSYPDIIFELKDEYGAGWSIYTSVMDIVHGHEISSGCHKRDRAVALFANLGDRKPVRGHMTLMDVAPTVLDLLGVEGNFNFDGRSIFKVDD